MSAHAPPEEIIDSAHTVEEAVDRARKVQLVNQFRVAVTLYIVARGLSIAILCVLPSTTACNCSARQGSIVAYARLNNCLHPPNK